MGTLSATTEFGDVVPIVREEESPNILYREKILMLERRMTADFHQLLPSAQKYISWFSSPEDHVRVTYYMQILHK